MLFTRTDRLPFFTEYVSKLNNDEATRILGVTLPIVEQRQGIYAEQETNRLGTAFEKLFRSLCNARPTFLSRETEATHLAAVYEFPREFRKVRQSLVRFLVELCRPSQIDRRPLPARFLFLGRPPHRGERDGPRRHPGRRPPADVWAPPACFALAAPPKPREPRPASSAPAKCPSGSSSATSSTTCCWPTRSPRAPAPAASAPACRAASCCSARSILCLFYSTALVLSFRHNRTLANNVKQASQSLASVDTSGSTAASVDSLRKLETLRQSLEILTKYNREGAPLGFRWGLYIGNDLYPDVRKLYFADFGKLLLTPTQNILVDFMRTLPSTPTGPEYGFTYDSLKAYLETTSNHDKATRSFLPPVLLSRWSANRNVDPERLQLAQKQFEFYSDELKIANPFSPDNDAAAIGKARLYLSLFAGFERVYQAMLSDAAKTGPVLNFNKKFPGSAEVVLDNQDVASPFTKPGWDFMKAALKNPEKYFAGEAWVLGEQATQTIDRSKLGQQLADRYYSDYIKEWRAYMKAASVVRYASLPDASKKLSVQSGNTSPLLELFWLASQNTAVDQPDVANAFQPVQTVVPPTSVDRYIAAPNQTYMNGLVTLQASVDTASQQQPVTDAAAASTLTSATAAKVSAKQVAQAFRVDADAHVDQTVQKLMEDPITYVEALLRNLGPEELNGKGRGLCAIYRPVLNKYPFNPASTVQSTVAEINGIFHKPDGALWKFYDENLQKLLPKQGSTYVAQTVNGVSLTSSFVNFFNNAAAFTDFAYGGNSPDPHFTYTLKPIVNEEIQSMGLQLDGQSITSTGSADVPGKQFVWQASGTHEAKATVRFGGPDLTWSNSEGLWAIFQFFNKAETWTPAGTGNIVLWTIRVGQDAVKLPSGKPLTVRFNLDMNGGPQVFQKGYFSRMACVAEVAK